MREVGRQAEKTRPQVTAHQSNKPCACVLCVRRSSKVAVALAAGGLVPPLLEPLMAAAAAAGGGGSGASGRSAAVSSSAPILRAKLLDIISIMYQHHPRPKEFIMKYRIQVGGCSRVR